MSQHAFNSGSCCSARHHPRPAAPAGTGRSLPHGRHRQLRQPRDAQRRIALARVLPARRARKGRRRPRRTPAVLAEDPPREPAPERRRAQRHEGRRSGPRRMGPGFALRSGGGIPACARAAAGLHRRAVRRRPGSDARRHQGARRRSAPHQPAAAVRPRDRPLGPGRPVRLVRRIRLQRPPGARAQPRAIRAAALGAGVVR